MSEEQEIKRKKTSVESAGLSTKETPACDNAKKPLLMDIGQQNFAKIRNLPAYVDKSMLIKEVIDGNSYILLTAPRRFGKSVNLNMLQRFFEKCDDPNEMKTNRELFKDLAIEKYDSIVNQYFGIYPIIYMDFKTVEVLETYDDAFRTVCNVVHKTYRRHMYLQYSDKIKNSEDKKYIEEWCSALKYETRATKLLHITNALENLAEYLCVHFDVKEIMLLVDEYDSICSNAIFCVEDYVDEMKKPIKAETTIKNIIQLCSQSLMCLAKGNDKVARVVLTGISCLMTQGLSQLNNIQIYKFQEIHSYTPFYGLTVSEVKQLLKKFSLDSKFDEIESYYNGYRNNMFGILSVMKYLELRRIRNFWKESGLIVNLDQTLHISLVKSIVSKLLSDLSNEIEILDFNTLTYGNVLYLKTILRNENPNIDNVDIFLNFLLEQGYFKVVENKVNTVVICIPNLEIKCEFQEKLFEFYMQVYNLDFSLVKGCAFVFDQINTSDENNKDCLKEICCLLNKIINLVVFPCKNEATLHHIIFVIVFSCCKFKCFYEIITSDKTRKRLDLLLLHRELNLGIIIELKYDKNAEQALEQIIVKKYYDAFEKYNPGKVNDMYKLFVGLHMSSEKEITMSVLFNSLNADEKTSFVNTRN